MKPKSEMMKSLHDQRKKAGFVKKSYWCHKDVANTVQERLERELSFYWQNLELPNNKKSN
jgi:hypothetical protein